MRTGATYGARAGTGSYEGRAGRINYRWWSAADPRWVVALAHGFGDHSGRWSRYADTLVEWGGAVFACDHRGHGLSEGARVEITDFHSVALDFLDLRAVAEFPAGAPVVVHGHSMGGLIAVLAALQDPAAIQGLVASSTRLGRWAVAELVLESARRGEALPPEAKGDPLLTLQAYLGGQAQLAQARPLSLEVPTLYLHGSEDPVIPYRGSVETLARLVPHDLEVRIFPGARHSIYNEINRDEILGVLRSFLTRFSS
jgi:alpha-beta hydrolase superfamily lysophospholipase